MNRAPARQQGFSLVEIAIVLAILGFAALGLMSSLSRQAEQRSLAETRALLARAEEALLAFAMANGRLPCPALAASAGHESIASSTGGTVACSAQAGFLPAATLGMPGLDRHGLLNDGWRDGAGSGNATHLRALRYGLSSLASPVTNALSSPGLGGGGAPGNRLLVRDAIDAGAGLFVCHSTAGITATGNRCGGIANSVATNAVAIVWSRGQNGNSQPSWSASENQNAFQSVARVYINREMSPSGAVDGGFDDQLTWISWPLLADRLIAGGHAP